MSTRVPLALTHCADDPSAEILAHNEFGLRS